MGFSVVCIVFRIVLIWFSDSTYGVFGGMYCFSDSTVYGFRIVRVGCRNSQTVYLQTFEQTAFRSV